MAGNMTFRPRCYRLEGRDAIVFRREVAGVRRHLPDKDKPLADSIIRCADLDAKVFVIDDDDWKTYLELRIKANEAVRAP